MANKQRVQVDTVPATWSASEWSTRASAVWPHTKEKARYVIRSNRDALITCGAVTRVGRELVIMGGPYMSWLQKQSSRVAGFDIACNANRQKAA